MDTPELQTRLEGLDQRIDGLERILRDIKARQDAMPALPKTNLLSGSFLSRAFAVLGHYIVASLIIVLPIYIVIFIILLVVGVSMMG